MPPRLSNPRISVPRLNVPRIALTRSRSSKDVVGLDIEPGFVAAVQAHVNGSVRVQHAAGMPLNPDVVREGEVQDIAGLADALRGVFRDSKLSRNVRIGLANQRTVLRTLELPPIDDRKEMAAAVRFQAEDEVPMPLNSAVLDFQPLGLVDTPNGPRERVALVAAQRDMVERLLEAARLAGLRPVGVDLAAFALIRSLYRPAAVPERLVYLAVGGLSNMAIADGPICRFTRVLGGGLEAMAIEVASRRELPLAEARELLTRVGLDDEQGADIYEYEDHGAYAPTEVYHQSEQAPYDPYAHHPASTYEPAPGHEHLSGPASTSSYEQAAGAEHPTGYEQAAADEQAHPGYDQPAGAHDQATTGYDQATTGYDQATTGYDQVAGGYDETTAGYDQVAGGYDETTAGYDQAAGGYDETTAGYDQAAGGYDQAAGGYDQATAGYDQAPQPEQQPAAYEQPVTDEATGDVPAAEHPAAYGVPLEHEARGVGRPRPPAPPAPAPDVYPAGHAPGPPAGAPDVYPAAHAPGPASAPSSPVRVDYSREILAEDYQDVRSVLQNGVREIAGEVRNSLDYSRAQDGGEPVVAIVLSGPALEVPGFAEALEHELGLPVRPGTVGAVSGSSYGLVSAQRLAVATGLAIVEVPA
jgi:type IV pilus assembly protein PilM